MTAVPAPEGLNAIIHQSRRLRIMSMLNAMPVAEKLEFTRLRAMFIVTDGNRGAHLGILETAGYIAIEKHFVGRGPRTRAMIMADGRAAFTRHVDYPRQILDGKVEQWRSRECDVMKFLLIIPTRSTNDPPTVTPSWSAKAHGR